MHHEAARIFFTPPRGGNLPVARSWCSFRTSLRLRACPDFVRISDVSVLRFDETINGRSYTIEVLSVGRDRWRADVARTTGTNNALMPFYGRTPDEAVRELSTWLTRAGRATNAV